MSGLPVSSALAWSRLPGRHDSSGPESEAAPMPETEKDEPVEPIRMMPAPAEEAPEPGTPAELAPGTLFRWVLLSRMCTRLEDRLMGPWRCLLSPTTWHRRARRLSIQLEQ